MIQLHHEPKALRLTSFGNGQQVLAFLGGAESEMNQICRIAAADLWNLPEPDGIDPIDERAWHVYLIKKRLGQDESAIQAAARVLLLNSLEEARQGYTATLYDWPDALPEPMSWPVAEVSRLFVSPLGRTGGALAKLWRAMQEGFAPPEWPRWWVGSVSAWRLNEPIARQLLHWPALPDSGFKARYPLEDVGEPLAFPPKKPPPHWRLFEQAGARSLARGLDPLLDNAPDALLAIDWEKGDERT